jgi:hypothetical protein
MGSDGLPSYMTARRIPTTLPASKIPLPAAEHSGADSDRPMGKAHPARAALYDPEARVRAQSPREAYSRGPLVRLVSIMTSDPAQGSPSADAPLRARVARESSRASTGLPPAERNSGRNPHRQRCPERQALPEPLPSAPAGLCVPPLSPRRSCAPRHAPEARSRRPESCGA